LSSSVPVVPAAADPAAPPARIGNQSHLIKECPIDLLETQKKSNVPMFIIA
jgi:hypothetical protein